MLIHKLLSLTALTVLSIAVVGATGAGYLVQLKDEPKREPTARPRPDSIVNSIGTRAIIGANAVVTKPVPPYCVAGGVPGAVLMTGADGPSS